MTFVRKSVLNFNFEIEEIVFVTSKGESTESWNPKFHWIPLDSKDLLGFQGFPRIPRIL
jgi:hypothetical protein